MQLWSKKGTFSAWNSVDLNDVWSVTIFRHCVIPRKVAGLSVTVNSACLAMYTVNSLYQTCLTRTIINITLVNCNFKKAMIYWCERLVFVWRQEWTCLKAITNGTDLYPLNTVLIFDCSLIVLSTRKATRCKMVFVLLKTGLINGQLSSEVINNFFYWVLTSVSGTWQYVYMLSEVLFDWMGFLN